MASPTRIVIRKYENRRLYDTTASRYVNLDEVAEMIRQGADVQVLDSKTDEDITRVVLTQIITDQAKTNDLALPLDILRQIILASDHARTEMLSWYLRSSFENFHRVQQMMNPLGWMSNFGTPPPAPATGTSEVEELRKKVEDLERRLAKSSQAPPTRRGKRPD